MFIRGPTNTGPTVAIFDAFCSIPHFDSFPNGKWPRNKSHSRMKIAIMGVNVRARVFPFWKPIRIDGWWIETCHLTVIFWEAKNGHFCSVYRWCAPTMPWQIMICFFFLLGGSSHKRSQAEQHLGHSSLSLEFEALKQKADLIETRSSSFLFWRKQKQPSQAGMLGPRKFWPE